MHKTKRIKQPISSVVIWGHSPYKSSVKQRDIFPPCNHTQLTLSMPSRDPFLPWSFVAVSFPTHQLSSLWGERPDLAVSHCCPYAMPCRSQVSCLPIELLKQEKELIPPKPMWTGSVIYSFIPCRVRERKSVRRPGMNMQTKIQPSSWSFHSGWTFQVSLKIRIIRGLI
jgi:hypothetical protein